MDDLNPITRTERLLDGEDLTPTNREEMFIKRIYDKTQEIPEPVNRKEYFLKKAGEAGGDVTVVPLNVTDNGTYSEQGKAYSPVTVNVEPPEDSYQLKSITTPTSLATFNASAMPMPKLKASIVAKQASGVPSPSNPLPISGWDAVVVSDVGKNLLPPTELSGTRNGITVTTVKDANDRIIGYSFSGTATAQTDFYVKTELNMDVGTNRIYSIRESEISGLTGMILPSYDRTTTNRVTNKAISSFVIRIDNGTVLNNAIVNPMICNESEGTTFVPYNGVTTTISLAQTVYGGEVDVVNGVLKITHLYEEFDETATVSFGRNGESNWYYVINGNTADASVLPISNMYVGASIGNNNDNLGICKVTNGQIRVRVGGTQPATVDDFVTALGTQHLQVLSVLATPTTIPLTPSLIKSLNGHNNLSVDSGEVIEGEYFKALGGE